MKNTIFLDSGVISLYQSGHEQTLREIKTLKKNDYIFLSSDMQGKRKN